MPMSIDNMIDKNDKDSPILVLSPQLANQIAAGEVVERPASVVKELVENSLDGGATKVIISIEQGGQKKISIQDNGKGISKDQLSLALSRHATSKIRDIDDLERITSMGFRGEALASISSVSRLTLTSKPANQTEAWQAFAEGAEMAVELKPAAHPDGTSVEVLDLFFNTPARRKFMRTTKTEFQHIEQVVKRIALARMDVEFVVNHNQKKVLRFAGKVAPSKRIAQVCSNQFMDNAVAVDYQFEGVRLHGFCSKIGTGMPTRDYQYTYVNDRMMKDRLLSHAIRQVYEEALAPQKFPAYVLFLDLAPEQIDVNVHPAKHEVRFHESRKIHDLVFKALTEAIGGDLNHCATTQNHDYIRPLTATPNTDSPPLDAIVADTGHLPQPKHRPSGIYRGDAVSRAEVKANNDFYQNIAETAAKVYPKDAKAAYSQANDASNSAAESVIDSAIESTTESQYRAGNALLMYPHVIIPTLEHKASKRTLKCIELVELLASIIESKMTSSTLSQPLLMPVSIALRENKALASWGELFVAYDFDVLATNGKVILKQVPSNLRNLPWAAVFAHLIADLQNTQQNNNRKSSQLTRTEFSRMLANAWLASIVVDNDRLQIWLNEIGPETLQSLPFTAFDINLA